MIRNYLLHVTRAVWNTRAPHCDAALASSCKSCGYTIYSHMMRYTLAATSPTSRWRHKFVRAEMVKIYTVRTAHAPRRAHATRSVSFWVMGNFLGSYPFLPIVMSESMAETLWGVVRFGRKRQTLFMLRRIVRRGRSAALERWCLRRSCESTGSHGSRDGHVLKGEHLTSECMHVTCHSVTLDTDTDTD